MIVWVERFESVQFVNDHVQVVFVTRGNEVLTMQMTWETFDQACVMFSGLKPT